VVGFVAFNKNLEYRSNFGGTISAVLLGIAFRQSENPECENLNEKRGPRSPEKPLNSCIVTLVQCTTAG
jgi:hypothetical protein